MKLLFSTNQWLMGTECPDEQYWQTLLFNSPGNYPGDCLEILGNDKLNHISRYQVWDIYSGQRILGLCKGKFVHGSCVFGVGDLTELSYQPYMVAHKVYSDYQPATFYCMLEWIHNPTYSQKESDLNLEYYKHLPCVFGVGDLTELSYQPYMVAHKVYSDYQPATFYCMLEWIHNPTYSQKESDLNLEYYKHLPAVVYHNGPSKGKTVFNCTIWI